MTKITIERETLLPCPFCGCGAAITGTEWDGREQYFVACTGPDCHCAVGENYDRDACPEYSFSSKAEAIAAWNRRAALAAQQTSGVTCTMTDAPCTRNCGLACSLQMEALAAQPAEPVMTIGVDESEKCRSLPFGMKLYAAPLAPAQQEPVAWLHICVKPGRREVYATVDPDDNKWWPADQWTSHTVHPLYAAPPAPAAVPLTDEKIDHTLATTLDEFARTTRGMSHALDVNADITANSRLRRMFARAMIAAAGDKP